MQTAVPVKPASITGPSHQIGRPVAITTRAPASPARVNASMLRWLTRSPVSSSRVPSMSVTTITGAGPGSTRRARLTASALAGGTNEGTVTGSLSSLQPAAPRPPPRNVGRHSPTCPEIVTPAMSPAVKPDDADGRPGRPRRHVDPLSDHGVGSAYGVVAAETSVVSAAFAQLVMIVDKPDAAKVVVSDRASDPGPSRSNRWPA